MCKKMASFFTINRQPELIEEIIMIRSQKGAGLSLLHYFYWVLLYLVLLLYSSCCKYWSRSEHSSNQYCLAERIRVNRGGLNKYAEKVTYCQLVLQGSVMLIRWRLCPSQTTCYRFRYESCNCKGFSSTRTRQCIYVAWEQLQMVMVVRIVLMVPPMRKMYHYGGL